MASGATNGFGNGRGTFAIDFSDTPFLRTSVTKAHPNRLNWRCELLLTRHREAIAGKKVLDLASHDGRFSAACLRLGARSVVGVEGRQHLVDHAGNNLRAMGFRDDQFRFIQGDLFDHLAQFAPGDFDTILCLGFFYHTVRQTELLREIRRLAPQHLILDTYVVKPPQLRIWRWLARVGLGWLTPKHAAKTAYMRFKRENHGDEWNTIEASDVVGVPTESLVQMLLEAHGFRWNRIDWKAQGISDWSVLDDYRHEKRASYIATARRAS